jgi:CBS-domain-containing membrane protein
VSPRTVTELVRRSAPVLRDTDELAEAVRAVLASDVPALPVVDAADRYVGLFGEREFIGAIFPQYLQTLGYAGFVPRSIDAVLEKRRRVAGDQIAGWLNEEHIDVPDDASDAALAETFLHHRVIVVPVTDAERRVVGVVLRADFFRELAERYVGDDTP